METTSAIEDIIETIQKYDAIIYSDDSEFRCFLEKYEFEETFNTFISKRFENAKDAEIVGLIVPISKFLLAEYLLAFNISSKINLVEELEDVCNDSTQGEETLYNSKKVTHAYTIRELYKILKDLDDQSTRGFLLGVDDNRFSDLYQSIKSSDFESFKKLMDGKSTSYYSKLIETKIFRFDFLSDKLVNNEIFHEGVLLSIMDLGYAVIPTIAECTALLGEIYDFELSSFRIEKCTEFMDIYPIAMSEISMIIAEIQSYENFSVSERKELGDISNRYSFLFEDIDLTQNGASSENEEVIKRKALKLGTSLHTTIIDELNSRVEEKDEKAINKDSKFNNFKIQEFILNCFAFENKEAKDYFFNNYFGNICRYFSLINSVKDFQILCYIFYPFDFKPKSKKDTIKKHLTGEIHWIDEPKDKFDCAHKIFELCTESVKNKYKSEYDNYNKYIQSKLRNFILEKAIKPDYKWMIRFVEDYWPKSTEKYEKDIRGDLLRDYKDLIEGNKKSERD